MAPAVNTESINTSAIADLQMPEMDGIELTEKLRASGVADTYVIMLTVRDSEFDYDRGATANDACSQ